MCFLRKHVYAWREPKSWTDQESNLPLGAEEVEEQYPLLKFCHSARSSAFVFMFIPRSAFRKYCFRFWLLIRETQIIQNQFQMIPFQRAARILLLIVCLGSCGLVHIFPIFWHSRSETCHIWFCFTRSSCLFPILYHFYKEHLISSDKCRLPR